ncbi:hypothetical protein FGIG_11421 [Fasciola gigantica]|uniref:Uncharacterized protein n=1 Tax=Fasciola gigantica TaxID=46835 RepID=A0A504YQG6_FASGI|nr:hypothetical protein FGIG_11421 [Fasciola gigantica]
MKHALLAKLSSFLYDCLRRTPDQRSHFSTKRPSQDTKELVV